jgi:putative MATE family efflux protein
MESTRKLKGDMTVGNPLKLILIFSIPLLVGNIFQQLYNVVDTTIIGHVLGDDALASIGATTPIYNLVINFANGLTNGFAVVIARCYGKKDIEALKKSVSLTMLLTLIVSVVLTVVSVIGINPLLNFLNTPQEIIKEASSYLMIILSFSIVTMMYNMFASMLRAIGNSSVPLYSLIVSTVINIVLDIVFVRYLSMGIAGAGYATVIAQAVSVIVCVVYIYRHNPMLKFDRTYLKYDKYLVNELTTTGLSMALMLAIVEVGSVALQGAVNSFGANTITAHSTARKIDGIFMMPISNLCMACSTFVSQNFGANRMDRVKKGIISTIKASFIWSTITVVLAFLCCDTISYAITGTSDVEILQTIKQYVTINVPFFYVLSILLILRSSLQGIGKKIVPLSASIIELISKFVTVGFVAPIFKYMGVCWLEPVIWTVCAILVGVAFIVYMRPYSVSHNEKHKNHKHKAIA